MWSRASEENLSESYCMWCGKNLLDPPGKIFPTPMCMVVKNHAVLNHTLNAWASKGFFQGGFQKCIFPGEAKNEKISFFPLETRKTFFAKNLIGSCQIPERT